MPAQIWTYLQGSENCPLFSSSFLEARPRTWGEGKTPRGAFGSKGHVWCLSASFPASVSITLPIFFLRAAWGETSECFACTPCTVPPITQRTDEDSLSSFSRDRAPEATQKRFDHCERPDNLLTLSAQTKGKMPTGILSEACFNQSTRTATLLQLFLDKQRPSEVSRFAGCQRARRYSESRWRDLLSRVLRTSYQR